MSPCVGLGVDNRGQDCSRNRRDPGNKSEEQNHCSSRTNFHFKMRHFDSPWFLTAQKDPSSEALLAELRDDP